MKTSALVIMPRSPWLASPGCTKYAGVPVLDMVLVVWLRLRARRAPWIGDRRHLSHRLVRRGLRPHNAVLVLWGATAGCGIVAVALGNVGLAGGLMLIGILVVGLGFLMVRAGTEGLY